VSHDHRIGSQTLAPTDWPTGLGFLSATFFVALLFLVQRHPASVFCHLAAWMLISTLLKAQLELSEQVRLGGACYALAVSLAGWSLCWKRGPQRLVRRSQRILRRWRSSMVVRDLYLFGARSRGTSRWSIFFGLLRITNFAVGVGVQLYHGIGL